MKPNSLSFCEKHQLEGPIILAPMAGGPGTPELVAAVSEAGGMGSIGAAYLTPQAIYDFSEEVRAKTKKPFAVNLFCPHPVPEVSEEQKTQAIAATRRDRQMFGLPEPVIAPPYEQSFLLQMEVVIAIRPAVVSFVFGVPPVDLMRRCRTAGIQVWGTATNLSEAVALQDAEVDAVILQGFEAGGHRALFSPEGEDHATSLDVLLAECQGKISKPMIAAGGLMDEIDIMRVLDAGASAVQMGTAFLLCPEAGTSEPYRQELLKKKKGSTRVTRAFSGRWARGLENEFMNRMDENPELILPFPVQNAFTRDLRTASAKGNQSEYLSLWAGTEFHRATELSAANLVRRWIEAVRS